MEADQGLQGGVLTLKGQHQGTEGSGPQLRHLYRAVCTPMKDVYTLNIHINCKTETNQDKKGQLNRFSLKSEGQPFVESHVPLHPLPKRCWKRRCMLRSTEDSHGRAATRQHQNPVEGFGSYECSNPLPRGRGSASQGWAGISLSHPATPQGASPSVQVAGSTTCNTRSTPPPDHQAPGQVCWGRQPWTWEEPKLWSTREIQLLGPC